VITVARAAGAGTVLPIVRELPRVVDPLALYTRLSGGGRQHGSFLLESRDGAGEIGRRSIVGLSSALRISCHGEEVRILAFTSNGQSMLPWIPGAVRGAARVEAAASSLTLHFPHGIHAGAATTPGRDRSSPLEALRALPLRVRCAAEDSGDLFLAAGLLSYELACPSWVPGATLADRESSPLYEFFIPERLVFVDHRLSRTLLVAHAFGGGSFDDNRRAAVAGLDDLERAADAIPPAATEAPVHAGLPFGALSVAEPDISDEAFAEIVAGLRERLERGEVYQVVPSRSFSTPCRDPLAAYAVLRDLEPSPYQFYVRSPRETILGASPEPAVRIEGLPPRVTVRPIAGTAPRGIGPDGSVDPELDMRRAAALLLDVKETAEHMMLVDLARNDVARVCRPGTRRVTRLLELEKYARIMHLVSEVQGELADGLDALDAYLSTMNPGTLVGAPKIAAAKILGAIEHGPRGIFGGAVGYLTASGRLDSAIAIRTAVVREGVARARAGAGVVLGSNPAREAMETRRKAEAVLHAVAIAEGRDG
jgi:anthranilate synthase component 1